MPSLGEMKTAMAGIAMAGAAEMDAGYRRAIRSDPYGLAAFAPRGLSSVRLRIPERDADARGCW